MADAYPLAWPAGFPRTQKREKGQFRTSLPGALKNVRDSLSLFGRDSGKAVGGVVMSSNYSLGHDRPADPGVAVYFIWDGMQVCIPVDRYETVEANLQAIHYIIEARRVELRHGTLALVRASFTGFKFLSAPKRWQEVLGLSKSSPTIDDVEREYRQRARALHPDAGGSDAMMAELNAARDAARKELCG